MVFVIFRHLGHMTSEESFFKKYFDFFTLRYRQKVKNQNRARKFLKMIVYVSNFRAKVE